MKRGKNSREKPLIETREGVTIGDPGLRTVQGMGRDAVSLPWIFVGDNVKRRARHQSKTGAGRGSEGGGRPYLDRTAERGTRPHGGSTTKLGGDRGKPPPLSPLEHARIRECHRVDMGVKLSLRKIEKARCRGWARNWDRL